MKCPICRKDVQFPSLFAPFCSERCKLIDLGNWASEKYVISTPIRPSDAAEPEREHPANDETEGDEE